MKICLIAEAVSSHTKRFSQLLVEAGLEVHLVSPSYGDIPGVTLHHNPIYDKNVIKQIKNIRKIKNLFSQINPDIYHLFGLFPVLSLRTMGLVNKLKPLVISVWGSDVDSDVRKGCKLNFIRKKLLSQGQIIISSSNYLTESTRKYLESDDLVQTVYWGVDLDKFYPPESKRTDSGPVVIGFAKALYELSAPDILLKAFAKAKKLSNKEFILKIAGKGAMENDLKEMALELEISESIKWIGYLDGQHEMLDFYHSIDFLAMPSRKESFGMSAIEAGATGLPVIASQVGGLLEIIENNVNGLMVDVEDVDGLAKGIVLLVEDSKKRIKMGENGLLKVKTKFNSKEFINQILDIYAEVQKQK